MASELLIFCPGKLNHQQEELKNLKRAFDFKPSLSLLCFFLLIFFSDYNACATTSYTSVVSQFTTADKSKTGSIETSQLITSRDFQNNKYSQEAVGFDDEPIDPTVPTEPVEPSSDAYLSTNNWYVGNTAAGEWIQFHQVWLSEGNYRFTTRAIAGAKNKTVHLELNGQIVMSGVEIPSNGTNEFELTHLGHKHLAAGYYDIRLVFETGNVNCDMIFIRKDDGTGSTVTANDVAYSINRNDGMHIAPIGGAWGASSYLAKGGDRGDDGVWTDKNNHPFSREQVLSWNKQQIYAYTPEVTDQALDMYVSEQVEAKVDFIFSHGRGEIDVDNDIEDRDYIPGIGAFGCRQLKKLVNAIDRSVYAKNNLKVAYFVDNAVFPLAVESYLGKKMNWGDPECQEFLWNYCFNNFYETVPKRMLFERTPGVVPIQLWSANANYDYKVGDTKILEFLKYIKQKMIDTYGLTPSFILSKDFFSRDPRTLDFAEGVQAWFSWGKEIVSYETFKGKSYGFALNGGRYPLNNVWFNDWDPQTNTGTHSSNSNDYHQSALKDDGIPAIRLVYEYGAEHSFEWLVNESWFDWREGSTWYRSNHPEYVWPNQYIALEREFADRESESILLEAEACDQFYDRSTGNSGGAYRVDWYKDLKKDFYTADMGIDLDIYRPLHQINEIQNGGSLSSEFVNFSAGLQDVWGFDSEGIIQCQEVDGHPIKWQQLNKSLPGVTKLVVGRYYAWALTSNKKVMKAELPKGWSTNNCTDWEDVTDAHSMTDIDLNMSRVWAVDNVGKVYYRDLSAKMDWKNVPGELKSITADDEFVWGFATNDSIVCMSTQSKAVWDTISNPYQLTKIEAGATEVWGVNKQKEVYRINSAGDGDWEFVANGYTNVSVGYEQVWLSDDSGNMFRYALNGFEPFTCFENDTTDLFPTEVKQLPKAPKLNIQVYPNPFINSVKLTIRSGKSEEADVNLFDLNGREYLQQNIELNIGDNDFSFEGLKYLHPGIYIMAVSVAGKTERIKLVKMDE